MAWRKPRPPEELPEHLERFRPVDWLDAGEEVTDPDYDAWEAHAWHDRPRGQDGAVLAAYQRFRAARAAWELEHPGYVREQVNAMIERRVARRAEQEKRWRERGDRHAGRSPGPLHFRRHEHDD
jgi:hypothetical protein